jgi:hypothetical protein
MPPFRHGNALSPVGFLVLALLLPATAACLGETAGPDPAPEYPWVREAGNFTLFVHEDVTPAQIDGVLGALAGNAQRIMGHLQVTQMPSIDISLWSQTRRGDWEAAMMADIGQVYPWATGYTPAANRICLLMNENSPSEAVHEYAHLVSMQVNPTIPNNPRWLWEAVAIYETGEEPDLSSWSDQDLTFPGFTALNGYDNGLAYRWGYHLAAAIISRWGDEGYVELIRTNGDLEGTLGVSSGDFAEYAEEFVRDASGG